MDTKNRGRGRFETVKFQTMGLKDLVRVDTHNFNRGTLKAYMHELLERKRMLKKDIDIIDEVVRDVNVKVTRV